jgi:PAS domain S-box-containing protein
MANTPRVLILDNRPDEGETLLDALRQDDCDWEWRRARTKGEFLSELDGAWDAILATCGPADLDPAEAARLLRRRNDDTPLIAVVPPDDEDAALEALRAGAVDYVFEDRPRRLGPALVRAARAKQLRAEKELAERQRDQVFYQSPNLVCIGRFDGWITHLNAVWEETLGYSVEELLARPFLELVHPDDREATSAVVDRLAAGESIVSFENRHLRRDGSIRWLLWNGAPMLDQRCFYATGHDITDRKRAEEQLRLSEARLAGAYEIAGVGCWEWDMAGETTVWSKQMHEIFGVAPQEFDGRVESVLKWIHPEDRPLMAGHLQRVLAEPTHPPPDSVAMEFRLLRPDGGQRVVSARARGVYDERGRMIRMIGTMQDVTESKLALRRLRVQSETTRVLAEAASFDAAVERCLRALVETLAWQGGEVWLLDAAGEHLTLAHEYFTEGELGDALRRLRSDATYARGEGLPGRVWQRGEVVWADDMLSDQSWALPSAAAAGVRSGVGFPIRNENEVVGAVVLLSRRAQAVSEYLQATLDAIGGQLGQFLERKRTEAELRLRDRAMEAIGEGIVITDPSLPENPIIYVNPAFERITGYGKQDVLGRNCRFLRGRDTSPEAVAKVRAAVERQTAVSVELLNYRASGTPFWNALTITPLRDATGRLTHFVGVQSDVSERKKLEGEYAQAQKMESVGRLAGGVAHDFNNLLTVILGYGEALLDELEPESPLREMAATINDAGHRAAALTSQLLAFSRKQALEPMVLNINQLIVDLGKILPRLIGEDIQIHMALAPNLASARVDPNQIGQLVMNLAVNARDAMPAGGTLTLETQNVYLDERYARIRPEVKPGHYVLLAVGDTGRGMTEQVKARLFEPFFTTKGRGRGTGMGLATVFGIVKQSGGHIAAFSELGRCATFKIYLPEVDAVEAASRPLLADDNAPRGDETVLLVEDEAAVREVARRFLESAGYTVLAAENGARAMEVSGQYPDPIHLLATDVVMPEMSGRLLSERLSVCRPEMRVLYISGYADDVIVHHGVPEEGMMFLQKPFSRRALLRRVRALLDAPRS